MPCRLLRARRVVLYMAVALAGVLPAAAMAQAGGWPGTPTVTWTVSAKEAARLRPGARVALTVQGVVRDGWHVYALRQAPNGPTPLKVALEPNDVASAGGAPRGSKPAVTFDRAFNLDTPYYDRTFTLTVPARVNPQAVAGRHSIPVSVRFQTCNGQICEPPKTVRLSAAVNVAGR